ncbi:MAG: hypothetical protein ABIZ04_06225 [Opitutus sp.]
MRHVTVLCFLIALLFASEVPAGAKTGGRSFIERIRPEDYYGAETLFGDAFSRAHDLVVLRLAAAQPVSVLAIGPATAGDGYTLTVQLVSADAPGGWLKVSESLEAAFARQVLRAVEIQLHHQVTLSKFKRHVSKTDSDLWVYQKLSDGRPAAAVIAMEDTFDNPEATVFIDELLGGLQQLIGKEGAERTALVQKLDRTATDLIMVLGR